MAALDPGRRLGSDPLTETEEVALVAALETITTWLGTIRNHPPRGYLSYHVDKIVRPPQRPRPEEVGHDKEKEKEKEKVGRLSASWNNIIQYKTIQYTTDTDRVQHST